MAEAHLVCPVCSKTGPDAVFSARNTLCNTCRVNRYMDQCNGTPKAFISKQLSDIKVRIKLRKAGAERECDLTFEFLMELWNKQEGRCALTGLFMTHHRDRSGKNDFNVSVDRVRSTEGYLKKNVQLVCARVNSIKSDMDRATMYWWIKHLQAGP